MTCRTLQARKRRTIDEIELARLVDAASPIDTAFLEMVGPHRGEGALGAFSFGRGYGVVRGILRAHFIPIVDVAPIRWQRAMGIPAGAGKDAARALAKERFQRDAALFVRVKDDGRADAALIAAWGLRHGTEPAAHADRDPQ